jgi:hypothetical protein
MTRTFATVSLVIVVASSAQAAVRITRVEGSAPQGMVEIRGVGAGPFAAAMWEKGTPHLLPDARSPLLEPREGTFRNIYAPSVLRTETGWDVYYGGWDGADTGNDRIYRTTTRDFLTFGPRETVIEHGAFQHVCNVSVAPAGVGALAMACTTYPDAKGLNKPAVFRSDDGGRTWNGSPAPYAATPADRITIDGYPQFDAADVNGMNVLLQEDGVFRLYFGNFRDGAKVVRATSADGRTFRADRAVLDAGLVVNDVKKLPVLRGESRYLMALHRNTNRLWYSLSADGLAFAPARQLCENLGGADAYVVAVGWVTDGSRVLGLLYGAGAAPSLDANRIFARWLQKRVVLNGDDATEAKRALGPDRQLIEIGAEPRRGATLTVFADDGRTKLGTSGATDLEPGRAYEITVD